MLPNNWKLEFDKDTKMLRRWVLTKPGGIESRWKTRAYALAYAETTQVEEQSKKIRKLLKSLYRKHGITYLEFPSKTSESYYFIIRDMKKSIKVRVSTHGSSDKTIAYQCFEGPVDICELRSVIRKKLLKRDLLF